MCHNTLGTRSLLVPGVCTLTEVLEGGMSGGSRLVSLSPCAPHWEAFQYTDDDNPLL
jgi:hypothetical protein